MNPLISNEQFSDFLPSSYLSSVKNRIHVQEWPKEKIQTAMKTADLFEQEVILQDLLLAGIKMKTQEQNNMALLAAELYIQAPEDIQEDFLTHLMKVSPIFKIFSKILLASSIIHESMELVEQGSSGLTINQLQKEKTLAIILDKLANNPLII